MAEPEGDERPDGELLDLVRALRALADDRSELIGRLDRLHDRVATGRLLLAVVGDFKRGKSTLVNAIAGRELLPSGVVPLTAVATEVHFGARRTEVVFLDGRRQEVPAGDLASYVTERGNPANAKGVARVEVGLPQPFGAPGVVLVDTPGAGSANQHNTQAAYAALFESDGAVLVLSADSPVSDSEQALMARLGERGDKVFVVINRSDHLNEEEWREVEGYVVDRLAEHVNDWSGPYRTDARAALRSVLGSPGSDDTLQQGFRQFRDELERFVRSDLAETRRQAAIAELLRLSRQLEQQLQLESAAGAMDDAALEAQVQRLRLAAEEGHRLLAEDRVVLDHDAAALVERIAARLSARAVGAAAAAEASLVPIAEQVHLRRMAQDLRDVIEGCVRSGFEPVRCSVERELDVEWATIAGRFVERVRTRVADLVDTAEKLFDVHLPAVPLPHVEGQVHRFSYHFLTVESPTAPLGRMLASGLLLPPRMARRRALRAAQRRLDEEFAKHAGRARYDVAQRVDAARRELLVAMTAEYEETQRSLTLAAEGARSLLELSADGRATHDRRRADVGALVQAIESLDVRPPAAVPGVLRPSRDA